MPSLLDGRAGVWDIAPVLLYVGLAIACVNVLAVVLIARLGRRLSGTSHEVLPRAAGRVVSLTRALLSERVRGLPGGAKADDELRVPRRPDGEQSGEETGAPDGTRTRVGVKSGRTGPPPSQ